MNLKCGTCNGEKVVHFLFADDITADRFKDNIPTVGHKRCEDCEGTGKKKFKNKGVTVVYADEALFCCPTECGFKWKGTFGMSEHEVEHICVDPVEHKSPHRCGCNVAKEIVTVNYS